MKKTRIKTDAINFHFLGAEVLEKCPPDKGPYFMDGFLYYVEDFFDCLDRMVPVFGLADGYSEIYLDTFIEGPLTVLDVKTQNLNHAQKKEFLEGFDLGMEESCKAIELALLSPVADKAAA